MDDTSRQRCVGEQMSAVLYNRTRIPFKILADFIGAAADLVPLQRRANIHFTVTWGKYTSGSCGVEKGYLSKKKPPTVIRLRIRHPKRCPQSSAVEGAFDAFLVLFHEIFHASEYHKGVLTYRQSALSKGSPWKDRPQERRAMMAQGARARVLLEGCFPRKGSRGAKARAAILALADEFSKMGAIG